MTHNEDFEDLLNIMRNLYESKSHDYAPGDDRFANFRLSELSGIPAWKGIIIRMGDKFSRISEFAKKESLEVKDESVEDTLIDLANYSLLCLLAYYEYKNIK